MIGQQGTAWLLMYKMSPVMSSAGQLVTPACGVWTKPICFTIVFNGKTIRIYVVRYKAFLLIDLSALKILKI